MGLASVVPLWHTTELINKDQTARSKKNYSNADYTRCALSKNVLSPPINSDTALLSEATSRKIVLLCTLINFLILLSHSRYFSSLPVNTETKLLRLALRGDIERDGGRRSSGSLSSNDVNGLLGPCHPFPKTCFGIGPPDEATIVTSGHV